MRLNIWFNIVKEWTIWSWLVLYIHIGWYHSHPGYGCWLSGIDVETQKLNQDFHQTWVALVIDPIKTKAQQRVEIGAFRTLPTDYQNENNLQMSVRTDKIEDFGVHMHKYYSLDIEIECDTMDKQVFDVISNNNWKSILATQFDESYFVASIQDLNAKVSEKKRPNMKTLTLQTRSLQHEYITQVMTQLVKRNAHTLK